MNMKNIIQNKKLSTSKQMEAMRWKVRKCGMRSSKMQNIANKQSDIHLLFLFILIIINFVMKTQHGCPAFKHRYN